MTSGGSIETIGDNKEFAIADVRDVTIYFNGGVTKTNTSVNDTADDKYFDKYGTVKSFTFRPTETIKIVSMNGLAEFTDPITIVKDSVYTEKLDSPGIVKMLIRTTTTNSTIRLRVRGR